MFQHRRGQSLAGLSRDNRRNLLTTSLNDLQHSAISARLERVTKGGPVASKPKSVSAGMDDLLTSDGGKHDYDWLLTPPGTPLGESKPSLLIPAPARAPATRSGSVTRSSMIPGSQSETNAPVKPTRSISTSRPSTSSSFSGSQASRSVLNTSSMSVNSRPSTPTRRPVAPSQSRPSTPSRTKPPALSSRPSTPTSRPQIPSTVKPSPAKPTPTPPVTRTASRPSTPTRRLSTETPVPASPPIVRSPATTTRSPALASRARSPSPRPHSRQPLAVQDFPKEVPPNLRTTAPERPSSATSATRGGPGSSYSIHSTEYNSNGGGTVRRPSPVRGRDNSVSKERVLANGHGTGHMENNTGIRTPVSRPPTSTVDNGGFGRTISKKSMDMAIRHMDIRHSTGNMRSLAGSSIFPQSIRSTTSKIRTSSLLDTQPPNRTSNNKFLENGNAGNISDGKDRSHIVDLIAERLAVKLKEAEKMKETDLSISTRYDSFLLKEDLKSTEWLHSIDDQSPIFDHRFEQLPEPFGS